MRTLSFTTLLTVAFLGGLGAIHAADDEMANAGDFQSETRGAKGSDALNPETWRVFTSEEPMNLTIHDDPVGQGRKVLHIRSHENAGSYQGILQIKPVAAGNDYIFKVDVLNDREDPLQNGTEGLLSIEWLNDEGVEVAREESEPWRDSTSETAWKTFELTKTAPYGVTEARFVVLLRDRDTGEVVPGGAFYIDNFSILHHDS